MKKISLFVLALAACTGAHATTLYDQLNQAVDSGNGSWDGGAGDFGANYGLQVGQRVTALAGAGTLSKVTGRFLSYSSELPVDSALVQVFNLSGNTVGSLVGQSTVSGTSSSLGSGIFGLNIFDVTAPVSISGLVAGNDYLITLQPQGSHWGFLARQGSETSGTFLRDYSAYGNPGSYGYTDWTEMGMAGYGSGNANMRIEAVPEPATLATVGLGALGALRRRRKA